MQGAANPFDVGIEFGTAGTGRGDDINQPVTFTLDAGSTNLSVDDFDLLQFGARLTSIGAPGRSRPDSSKGTALAPAAPDAKEDSGETKEDVPITISVLANDTDVDTANANLRITKVSDGVNGKVAISADGRTLTYTPKKDWAGDDSFEYCMTDQNGGVDSAVVKVTVIPVADAPSVSVKPLATAETNVIKLEVTASQLDADYSEFIDRITFSGLPAGATITGGTVDDLAGEPNSVTKDYFLTLALDQSYDFQLGITAESEEEGPVPGQPDEATTTIFQSVKMDYKLNDLDKAFQAENQNIWSEGASHNLVDNRFIGINESFNTAGEFSLLDYNFSGSLKAGFQSKLTFNGGEVDATAKYDIAIDTNYNRTTNMLLVDTSASVAPGGFFNTVGPSGSYVLDFIFNWALKAGLSLDLPTTSVGILSFDEGSNSTKNLLNLNSENLEIPIELPYGLTFTLAWPNISTSGTTPIDPIKSSGASNNFADLNLDVDQLLADIFLGGKNPFDIGFDIDLAVASVAGNIQLLDFDLNAGLNLLQNYVLDLGLLKGELVFENGAKQGFTFGDEITLSNASSYDADKDGKVEFGLVLDPDATLRNLTDIGVNVGYNFDLVKLSGSYDVFGIEEGDFSYGPLVDLGGSTPVTSFNIYDETFSLNFAAAKDSIFA